VTVCEFSTKAVDKFVDEVLKKAFSSLQQASGVRSIKI